MCTPPSERPVVKLIGEDGNVFHVIGLSRKALREWARTHPDQKHLEQEFVDKAFKTHSYDEVLQLVMEYMEVQDE